jgi:hypothetical protein
MPAAAADDMNDEQRICVERGDGVSLRLSPASASASASTFSICFRFSDHGQVD